MNTTKLIAYLVLAGLGVVAGMVVASQVIVAEIMASTPAYQSPYSSVQDTAQPVQPDTVLEDGVIVPTLNVPVNTQPTASMKPTALVIKQWQEPNGWELQ